MIYRLLLILLVFYACQRKSIPTSKSMPNVTIDTSMAKPLDSEIPFDVLADVHHLLKLGVEKAGNYYDTLNFKVYLNPKMNNGIRVQTSGLDTVYLSIGHKSNKNVAFYSYLDLLGYKFYGPEDYWTYIPKVDRITSLDTLIESQFMFRQFRPTFSVGPKNNYSLERSIALYSRWTDRLRVVDNLQLVSGHYGSKFNRKYKEEITAHPEWRGKNDNGEIRQWSNSLKLCYSHPGVIELYKKDAKHRLEEMIKNQAPPYYINMEPPDGGGFCKCKECPDSVSDQVYTLVNIVADYLYTIDSNANVWIIAYNEHSPPPSFSLEKNVLVGLVPFGFQRNYSPTEFMKLWEKLEIPMFLRDYLAIPQWNFDEPFWQNGEKYLDRITHLKQNGYIGFNFETTSSFLSAGWPIYLVSKSAWEDINYQESLDLFQSQMFSTSQLELEVLIDYFTDARSSSYYYGNLERLIQSAIDKCTNQDELLRLKDFELYFKYMVLRSNYLNSTGTEKQDNRAHLLNFIFADSSKANLHSWGLYRSMVDNRSEEPFGKKIGVDEEPFVPKFILRSRKPRVSNFIAMEPTFHTEEIDTMPVIKFNNDPSGLVYIPDGKDLTIRIKVKNVPSTRHGGGRVSFYTLDGEEIENFTIDYENQGWNDILFTAPKGDSFYKLTFSNPAAWMSIQGPNRPFAFTEPLNTGVLPSPIKLWTLVPNQYHSDIEFKYLTRKVTIEQEKNVIDKFFVREPEIYRLNVSGLISITTTKASFVILNIPHLFSPTESQVIKFVEN